MNSITYVNNTYSDWTEASTNASVVDMLLSNASFNATTTAANPAMLSNDAILYTKVKNILIFYVGTSICAFGILCNCLNLIVLTQHQLKESPYTYLTALAITDLGALILSFVYNVFSHPAKNSYEWRFYDAHIYLPVSNICTNSSVWLVVLLTIERFLFVRYPLWAKAKCSRSSAKIKILILVCIVIVVNIPRFMAFRVDVSRGVPAFGSTEFRKSFTFQIITWAYAVIINFIPLTILVFANIYLLVAVKRARTQREVLHIRNNKEAAWQREQTRLTITLISILTLFIVCITPSAFADLPIAYLFFGEGYTKDDFRNLASYRIFTYVSNVLIYTNLSLNFVLYCAFNNKFRRVMIRWFKRCLSCPCGEEKSFLLLVKFRGSNSMTRTNSCPSNSISLQTKVSNLAPDTLLKPEKCESSVSYSTVSTTLVEKSENGTETNG